MSDDREARGSGASSLRAALSSVLTPPGGFPLVPVEARELGACRCGHDHAEHRHWRPGSDCGRCGSGACTAFRPSGGAWRRLLPGATRRP